MAPPTFAQRGNVMDYAAFGDIVGVPREFNPQNTFDPNFELVPEQYLDPYKKGGKNPHYQKPYANRCSDDTILSMAIAKSIMEAGDNIKDLDKITAKYLKEFVKKYPNDGETFPGWYGSTFVDWAEKPGTAPMTGRASCGDGSAMRVSAVGWAYNSLEKTLEAAKKTALPSHSHPEGIKGAQAIASAIYLARAGMTKEDIKAYLETKFDYDLDITCAQYQHYNRNELKKQTEICQTTVPMAIRAFLESSDENGRGYEDCLRKAITLGGDSDTIGAMAGSIAGAFYGMTKDLETKCESLLNDHLMGIAKEFQQFVASRRTEPDKAELEEAMAKARLESYLLKQAKADNPTPPSQDPQVLELLAKSEAARLFHEQVKAARQKNDKDLEQKLLDKREDILGALAKKCAEWPDLQSEYHVLEAWPVKQVQVEDLDEKFGKRNPGVPKTLPQQRAEVDHEAVAKLSVTRRIVIDEVLATKIGKFPEMPVKPKRAFLLFRPFRYLYHKIKGDYKPFSEKMAEYTEDYTRAQKITDSLKRENEFREHGKKDRENSEAERRRAYDEQQLAAASYNAEVDMVPKFIPAPVEEEPKVPQPPKMPEMPKVEELKAKEEKPALENDQKAEKIRTLKQKTETLERAETVAKGDAVTHEIDPVLIRQVHDVKHTLELKTLESSCAIQTHMRDDTDFAPVQDLGPMVFVQKVENYLNQVLNGKVPPNADFMETLADAEKFDDVYMKWTDSQDGTELGQKLCEKYFHENHLREDMEANPVLKSKLDKNANIEDDKQFVEKLIKEGFNVHRQFLNATLNAALDSEMTATMNDFSFIKEFKAPELHSTTLTVQTVETETQPDVSATAEPNVSV